MIKIWGKMRKVKFLPTRDSEAGYGLAGKIRHNAIDATEALRFSWSPEYNEPSIASLAPGYLHTSGDWSHIHSSEADKYTTNIFRLLQGRGSLTSITNKVPALIISWAKFYTDQQHAKATTLTCFIPVGMSASTNPPFTMITTSVIRLSLGGRGYK